MIIFICKKYDILSIIFIHQVRGGSRIFGGGGGEGVKICAHAHHEREPRSPFRPAFWYKMGIKICSRSTLFCCCCCCWGFFFFGGGGGSRRHSGSNHCKKAFELWLLVPGGHSPHDWLYAPASKKKQASKVCFLQTFDVVDVFLIF